MKFIETEEKEALAQELIEAAKRLCIASRKVQELLNCENFDKTPEALAEMEPLFNFPEIENISISLRSVAMRLDRAALIKSITD